MKTVIILSHVTFDNSPYCSYVHSHAKALNEQGYNVIVFALLNWFPFLSFFSKKRKRYYKLYKGEKNIEGIKVIYKKRLSFSKILYDSFINLNGLTYYATIKNEFRKILNSNDVYFVDAHTFKIEGYAAYRIKKKFRIKTFLTCHGSSLNFNLQTKNGIKQIHKYCDQIDKVICVSNKQKKQLNSLGINNVVVINNGINCKLQNKLNNYNHNIITVASLTSDKNIDKLIEAFKEIHLKYSDATLKIIGDGPLKNKLIDIVKKYKLDNYVSFVGRIDNKDVYRYLANSSIFVLISSPEGFGISYVEAMYNGCIAIGTKNEGIDGFIKNGVNGYLVNIDAKEVSELVCKIFKNLKNYERIRKEAIESASKLTWKENAKRYIELIGE